MKHGEHEIAGAYERFGGFRKRGARRNDGLTPRGGTVPYRDAETATQKPRHDCLAHAPEADEADVLDSVHFQCPYRRLTTRCSNGFHSADFALAPSIHGAFLP